MLKIFTTTLAGAAMAMTAMAPAAAMTVVPAKPATVQSESAAPVENISHRRGFYRERDRYWYNRHRGYRQPRRGYRNYRGYWFPPAAFAMGAIIGGAIANSGTVGVRPGFVNPQHVAWCHDRYRSYRASDNTFQPYNGPRRQCRSPYY